jgi:integrase
MSLRTSDLPMAKILCAGLFFSLARLYVEMRAKMAIIFEIGPDELDDPQRLLRRQFELGQQFEAARRQLVADFEAASEKLGQLIKASLLKHPNAPISLGWSPHASTALISGHLVNTGGNSPINSGSDLEKPEIRPQCPSIVVEKTGENEIAALKDDPWPTHINRFLRDKPGLAAKTVVSFKQVFREWEQIIGKKPVCQIRRSDVKEYADYLRDKPNSRGNDGMLARTTILRNLGHVKEFLAWCVSSGLAVDDEFKLVRARDTTKEERLRKAARRAFTNDELVKLFDSDVFQKPNWYFDVTDYWFFLLGLFTGGRVDELAHAPAKFVDLGGIKCLDLRIVAEKTIAAPRLVPIHGQLLRLGIEEFSRRQIARGYSLLQPGPEPRTESQWSKRLNERIDRYITDDATVVFYSFRHVFRQMLRAGALGDELMNKIFGHADGRVGSGYGRDLSADEAALFMRRVKAPIALDHLPDLSRLRRTTSKMPGAT